MCSVMSDYGVDNKNCRSGIGGRRILENLGWGRSELATNQSISTYCTVCHAFSINSSLGRVRVRDASEKGHLFE